MKKDATQKEVPSSNASKTGNDPQNMLIVERTAAFADRVIQLSLALPRNAVGWEIGRQIVRAGMSVGANVEEAQAAESRADFIHKLRIARKECRETRFFLKRIQVAELISPSRLRSIYNEAEQILRILTAILIKSEYSKDRNSSNTNLGLRRSNRVHSAIETQDPVAD